MVARAAHLSTAQARPVEWDALMPSDSSERVKWQVWARERGAGYWVMRYATRFARLVSRIERALGRTAPEVVTNPNGLLDGGTFDSEAEAQDLCRIVERRYPGRFALTYTPVVLGRVYPIEPVLAAGDRRFDPFKVFDFSATDAVKEQARHELISVDVLEQITATLTGIRRTAEPRL